MSRLPYDWNPLGSSGARFARGPDRVPVEVGAYVGFDHAAWRIIEVRDDTVSENGTTRHHARIVPVEMYNHPDPVTRQNSSVSIGWRYSLPLFPDEHYPICAACLEPLPCRHQMAQQVSEASAKRAAKFDVAGVCPACDEPVTQRQQSITFEENLYSPVGPPVTYHLRRKCHYAAVRYETEWAAKDPSRKMTFTCPEGYIVNHGDGTYYCSNGVDCPGVSAEHRSWTTCDCPEHRPDAKGAPWQGRGCQPPPNAVRVDMIGERRW